MHKRLLQYLTLIVISTLLPSARAQDATTHPSIDSRIDALRDRLPAFRRKLAELTARGNDVSYPTVTFTVLDIFTNYAVKDRDIAVPTHWGWVAVNGCESGFEPVRDAHGGKWAMRIWNKTPTAANVYGKGEQDVATKTVE